MKTLSTKYQKIFGISIIILGCFIVYRKYIIDHLYNQIIQESFTTESGVGGNMIAHTEQKIQVLEKRGKGQHEKMKDIQVRIETVNKELDKKLQGQ